MKLLLDTLDLEQIRKFSKLGILSGVTTNPTFSKRFGMKDDIDTIEKVSDQLGGKGEIFVEAFGHESSEIEDNAVKIDEKSDYDDLIFKVPFTEGIGEDNIQLETKWFQN